MLPRCPRLLASLVALVLPLDGMAGDAAERQRIAAARSSVEARFAAEEAACRQRFIVTPCVDDVRVRKREALDGLRYQELRLDDAERRRRAAERLQAIEARQAAAAARPPAPVVAAPAPRPSAAVAAAPRPPRPASDGAQAEAAARRAAAEKRREAAAADQARIAEREAKRAPQQRKSAPLPTPPNVP
jgi:colicin import membrane protein